MGIAYLRATKDYKKKKVMETTPEIVKSWQNYIESRIRVEPHPKLYEELGRTVMLLIGDMEALYDELATRPEWLERIEEV